MACTSFQLHPPTAVIASCSGRFRSERPEIAVATHDTVFFGDADEADVPFHKVFAPLSLEDDPIITALHVLTPPPGVEPARDVLLYVSSQGHVIGLVWVEGQGKLRVSLDVQLGAEHPSRFGWEVHLQRDRPVVVSADASPGKSIVFVHAIKHQIHVVLVTWTPIVRAELLAVHDLDRECKDDFIEFDFEEAVALRCLPRTGGIILTFEMLAAMRLKGTTPETGTARRMITKLEFNTEVLGKDFRTQEGRLVEPTTNALLTMPILHPKKRSCLVDISMPHAVSTFGGDDTATGRFETPLWLEAIPTSAAVLSANAFVVGDAVGSIVVVEGVARLTEGERPISKRICYEGGPLSFPTSMAAISTGDGTSAVFVGSSTSPSVLLSLDGSMTATARPTRFSESLAPIHEAVRIEDPADSGEGMLLMCCGIQPAGAVCLGRMSVALHPGIAESGAFEERPRLSTVADLHGHGHANLLVLSFEDSTTLLDISDGNLKELPKLSGFDYGSRNLLVVRANRGHILQVKSQMVSYIPSEGCYPQSGILQDHIKFETPVSMAAFKGNLLALVIGKQVIVLDVTDGLRHEMMKAAWKHEAPEQISAVEFLGLQTEPDPIGTVIEGRTAADVERTLCWWVALGQWNTNAVLLVPLESDTSRARLLISTEHGQPRSLALGSFLESQFLFVGTSDGSLWYTAIELREGKLVVGDPLSVRVGLGAVELEWCPGPHDFSPYLYAACEQAVVVTLPTDAKLPHSPPEAKALQVSRVHGSEGISSSCEFLRPRLPGARCWMDSSGKLIIGKLDLEVKLRCRRKGINETPKHVVYHPETGCALVVCEDHYGNSWLRLFHATSLRQLAAVEISRHRVSAICRARIRVEGGHNQCVPAVVVASIGEAASKGLRRSECQLHIIEIACQPKSDLGDYGHAIVLHGSVAIEGRCYALTAATDPEQTSDIDMRFETPHDPGEPFLPQLIVAGCDEGVHLYRILVRDVEAVGRRGAASAANALAKDYVAETRALAELKLARVHLNKVVQCELLFKMRSEAGGPVTLLSGCRDFVMGAELKGPASFYSVLSLGDTAIVRVSADPEAEGSLEAILQTSNGAYGALFPGGFVLYRTDNISVNVQQWKAFVKASKTGNDFRMRGREGPQPKCTPISFCVSWGCSKALTCFCHGKLNIRPSRHTTAHGLDDQSGPIIFQPAVADAADAAPPERVFDPVLYFTRSGEVARLQPWTHEEADVNFSLLSSMRRFAKVLLSASGPSLPFNKTMAELRGPTSPGQLDRYVRCPKIVVWENEDVESKLTAHATAIRYDGLAEVLKLMSASKLGL